MSWQRLKFSKMSGAGNDFIIIDNRSDIVTKTEQPELAKLLCRRTFSVGADGVIFVESSERADFRWMFYNADGSKAEMCGNGARCVTRYAYLNGIGGAKISFDTEVGIIEGAVVNNKFVRVSMHKPHSIKLDYLLTVNEKAITISSVNTGVPHVVIETARIQPSEAKIFGAQIRSHQQFQPAGTNVTFVTITDRNNIISKTFERGVEDFTLACGTGATAAAIISHSRGLVDTPVRVTVPGGIVTIDFTEHDGDYNNITLSGDARLICEGELTRDALLLEEQNV